MTKQKLKDSATTVIRTNIVRLDKAESYIIRLIKNRQHVWNNLVILYNTYEDTGFRHFIRDKYRMRAYYAKHLNPKSTKYRPNPIEEFNKYDFIMEHHPAQNQVFSDFYATYSNKLFVDIINEFNARIDSMWDNYKEAITSGKQVSPPQLHTKKLSHLSKGSITINSNCVKYDKNIFNLLIFNRKYFKENFDGKNVSKYKYTFYHKLPASCGISDINLVWRANKVFAHIHYKRDRVRIKPGQYSLSIDPGKKNFYTFFSDNPAAPSILLRNNSMNRINYIYNKFFHKIKHDKLPRRKDHTERPYPYTKHQQREFKKLQTFEKQRVLVQRAEGYKFTNRIIDYCKKYEIETIIIGRNKYQKTASNLGKQNNSAWHSIPHYRFNEILAYKCEELGINLQYQEESYTSKLDALNEQSQIWKYKYGQSQPTESVKKLGLRGSRSVYKSRKYNCEFNADVNGAINIMQKYKKHFIDAFATNHTTVFHPITIHSDTEFLNLLSN